MERLELDLVQLNKALKTLESALILQKEVIAARHQAMILAAEDSVIKRFEYTYEAFWKFLKKYLEQLRDVQDINSPRKVFYAAVKHELCTSDEGDIFLDMLDDRNATAHTYNIESVRLILSDVPRYCSVMASAISRFNQELRASQAGS